MKKPLLIDFRGMRIQAEEMETAPAGETEALLQLLLPSENRILQIKFSELKVFKIPVQGANGDPFSYHVTWDLRMETAARD